MDEATQKIEELKKETVTLHRTDIIDAAFECMKKEGHIKELVEKNPSFALLFPLIAMEFEEAIFSKNKQDAEKTEEE